MLFFAGVRSACRLYEYVTPIVFVSNNTHIYTSNVKTGGKEELLEKTKELYMRNEDIYPQNENKCRYDRS